MADLLPSTPDPSAGDGGDPRVIGVDSEDAADLLAALQSETAREILAALYDDPATPSALADAADTSIQNARYHLEKLVDADLVEVADTIYSEKGREMKVYAPAATPLVVFAGGDDDAPGVEAALSRLLGALGILGLSSLLVQRFFGAGGGATVDFQGQSAGGTTGGVNASADSDAGDDAAATTAESDGGAGPNSDPAGTTAQDADATEAATEATRTTVEEGDAATTVAEATRTAADAAATTADELARSTTTVADGAGVATAGLPPGLVFFLGGAVVLAALGIAWYVSAR